MRQADAKFTDFSPQGREVFRQAVEAAKRQIRDRGYVEFHDDNGVLRRINVPVMPSTKCAAYQCPRIVVGRAMYCFDHAQARPDEEAQRR